jgi:hypothetical protein
MRRLSFIPIIVLHAAFTFGQAQTLAPEIEARQRLCREIEGRNIQGRLYSDPWSNPEQFQAISIPFVNGAFQVAALESDYPLLSIAPYVLIRAEDQTDKDIAKVLDGFVFTVSLRRERNRSSLADLLGQYADYAPTWTFLDALGQPMAGASIEAHTEGDPTTQATPVYKATLDDKGQAPRRMGTWLTIRVEHPNYGVALVEYMDPETASLGVYILPLAPRNSPEFSLAAQGVVTDPSGKPVRNALVGCGGQIEPDGDVYPYPFDSRVVTDANGQFAICLPRVTAEMKVQGPPQTGARYSLEIEPPLESNLRCADAYGEVVAQAGTKQTFTLTAMDPQEYFHTFSFQYAEGPITDVDELTKIRLTLMRDNRVWRRLTYEQWKNGIALPQGELQASIMRWGESFRFIDAVLTAQSPTNILVKAPKPIVYRGRVVDGPTGKPMPNVVVRTDDGRVTRNPRPQTGDLWKQLVEQAVHEAADTSPQILYQAHNRASVTDANGVFQFTFVPGAFNEQIWRFSAIAPDRRTGFLQPFGRWPNRDGAIDVGTIKLLWPEKQRIEYGFPTMVFYDEKGPVTDPDRLKTVRIDIKSPTMNWVDVHPYDYPDPHWKFVAGTYRAKAIWNDNLYTFEPVEVNSPSDVVTFRMQKAERGDVVYVGRVVHETTSEPVANALVIYSRDVPEYDASCLTDEQWAAIRALGPQIDSTEAALVPVKNALAGPEGYRMKTIHYMTQTDANGDFTLPVEQNFESGYNHLVVIAPNFLGLALSLQVTSFPDPKDYSNMEVHRLEPDANGMVKVPLMELVPAAKVLMHPVVSDAGYNRRPDVLFDWKALPNTASPWTHNSEIDYRDRPDVAVFSTEQLQPNVTQSVYVRGDASVDLTIHSREQTLPPAHLGTFTLRQGEVLDLGRVKFPPAVRVVVRTVDDVGSPVPHVRVTYLLETGFEQGGIALTDENGCITLSVPANSTGTFRVSGRNRQTPTSVEATAPYKVAGPGDKVDEFVIHLSDDIDWTWHLW